VCSGEQGENKTSKLINSEEFQKSFMVAFFKAFTGISCPELFMELL
jgi:hypothetical protein